MARASGEGKSRRGGRRRARGNGVVDMWEGQSGRARKEIASL